jgi:hypothetical protein
MLLYLAAIACSCINTMATRAAGIACLVAVASLWIAYGTRDTADLFDIGRRDAAARGMP